MKLEQALIKLSDVLLKWGLTKSDWFLTLHYADILQGYDIPYDRNAHIHIMVPYDKIPWGATKKTICDEVATPSDSKFGQDLQKFIKDTGHDFNLVSEDPDYFYSFYKDNIIQFDIKGNKIPMVTPKGNLLWDERYMDRWVKEMPADIAVRRLQWRILKYEKAKEKKDTEVAKLSKDFIDKYEPFAKGVAEKNDEAMKKFKKFAQLDGEVACSGQAQGEVFIINDPDSVPEIKKNKVIVCKLTTPKLVSLIRNSKAIITDEGGLLSHAAITAREFKIPCVIGTKIATQVFKDGDLVEVNANTGIVRKI